MWSTWGFFPSTFSFLSCVKRSVSFLRSHTFGLRRVTCLPTVSMTEMDWLTAAAMNFALLTSCLKAQCCSTPDVRVRYSCTKRSMFAMLKALARRLLSLLKLHVKTTRAPLYVARFLSGKAIRRVAETAKWPSVQVETSYCTYVVRSTVQKVTFNAIIHLQPNWKSPDKELTKMANPILDFLPRFRGNFSCCSTNRIYLIYCIENYNKIRFSLPSCNPNVYNLAFAHSVT